MAKNTTDFDVVKKAHCKNDVQTEEQMLQLMQCVDDPLYFMRKFMKVQHPLKGLMDFKPYPYQVRIIEAFHSHRFTCLLSGRQLGKTTCAAGYLLWRALFIPDSTILIAANKFAQALEVMNKIRFGYEGLPDFIRAGVIEYNKSNVTFDNGSRLVARATSTDSGRGLAVSLLYCLDGETTVKIRDKKTGEIQEVSLAHLYDILV